jgi:hypothetical protein
VLETVLICRHGLMTDHGQTENRAGKRRSKMQPTILTCDTGINLRTGCPLRSKLFPLLSVVG